MHYFRLLIGHILFADLFVALHKQRDHGRRRLIDPYFLVISTKLLFLLDFPVNVYIVCYCSDAYEHSRVVVPHYSTKITLKQSGYSGHNAEAPSVNVGYRLDQRLPSSPNWGYVCVRIKPAFYHGLVPLPFSELEGCVFRLSNCDLTLCKCWVDGSARVSQSTAQRTGDGKPMLV